MKEIRVFFLWRRGFKELKNDILGDEIKVEGILYFYFLEVDGVR